MPANGLYGHIAANSTKSLLLMTGFVVLVAIYWWAGCLIVVAIKAVVLDGMRADSVAGGLQDLANSATETATARWYVPLVIALVWFAFAWAFYQRMIRAATGAKAVERRAEPKLYNMVETLAISAGLPMPRVEIVETDGLNAYAAGLTPGDSTIAVTRGLLDTLDKDELQAILAHEMTHIKNRDVRLMVVALIFAGGITFLGDLFRSLFSRSGDGDQVYYSSGGWDGASSGWGWGSGLGSGSSGGGSGSDNGDGEKGAAGMAVLAALIAVVAGFVVMCIAHVFALMTQFAISRSREFMADAGAIELTKEPDALISALSRIAGHDAVPCASEALLAMMFSRSFDGGGSLDRMFATHPPVEDRISSLQMFAGGRVREPRRVASRAGSAGPATASAPRTEPSAPPVPVGFRAQYGRRPAGA